jgi:hypothetical protein
MDTAGNTPRDFSGKVFVKNEDVVSRKIAGETLLVPVRGNLADMQMIFALNPVGELIWNELGRKNLSSICSDIIRDFEVEREQAETDVREFVQELADADLIRVQ